MNNQERARVAVEALHAGDPVTAVAHATEILGRGADETKAHLIAGMGMAAAGDWQAGESHLLEALAGDLGTLKVHAVYNLALCYEHQGRTDTAASLYSAAAGEYRDAGDDASAAKAHHNACWMLVCRERLAEATLHLSAAEGEPSVATEHTALAAYLTLRKGDGEKARTLANQLYEQCEKPWPLALACYVAGSAAVEADDLMTANLLYRRGSELLLAAQDPRLMNLYVGLRRLL